MRCVAVWWTSPGSVEWLAARKVGIGASESAAILGLSRYKSALDVYIDKTKDTLAPRPDSAASKRGRRLEPIVLDMYEEEYGPVHRGLPQITSDQHPFMFASLDAMRMDDGRPVEAKTAGKYVAHEWGEEGTDEIPTEYLIQVTHQMIVKGAKSADVATLITLDDFRRYPIERDNELADMVIEGLRLFWKRVESPDPPEPTSGEEVERLYRQSIVESVVADAATAQAFHELLEVRNALKPLEQREKKLMDAIKLFMRDRETLIIGNRTGCTWKTANGSRRMDVKRFQNDHPTLDARYMTQSAPSRRFLISGETHAS
jgi:putative phage-type endonuclease